MADEDTVPRARLNDKIAELNELKAKLAALTPRAELADKLSAQVESLKADKKALAEKHTGELTTIKKHSTLGDLGFKDEKVRNLVLSELGDVEDLKAAIDGLYVEGAEVSSILKPFLPSRGEPAGEEQPAAAPAGPTRQTPTDSHGRSPAGAKPSFTAEQVLAMSDEEFIRNLGALGDATGYASMKAIGQVLAPPRNAE